MASKHLTVLWPFFGPVHCLSTASSTAHMQNLPLLVLLPLSRTNAGKWQQLLDSAATLLQSFLCASIPNNTHYLLFILFGSSPALYKQSFYHQRFIQKCLLFLTVLIHLNGVLDVKGVCKNPSENVICRPVQSIECS